MLRLVIFTICSAMALVACGPKKAATTQQSDTQVRKFVVPQIPVMISEGQQKADFLMGHYWDNFDFKDTSLISDKGYTEQGFVDFVNIISQVSEPLAQKGVATLMEKASVEPLMYRHFVALWERYLYDPNSPMRNEDLYIVVLGNLTSSDHLSVAEKARPAYQLELAMKNRVGDKATDFSYTTEHGTTSKLYQAKGDPLLLFFFRPDCPSCQESKDYIKGRGIDRRIEILYVNPDTDPHLEKIYDLRASPVMYLLSGDKKVLLKDATIDQVEYYINTELSKESAK